MIESSPCMPTEQNASTSTVRVAGSTGANPFACISAGIGIGGSHGGANEACLNMSKMIGDESQIETFIAKAKDRNDPFRLMGFTGSIKTTIHALK